MAKYNGLLQTLDYNALFDQIVGSRENTYAQYFKIFSLEELLFVTVFKVKGTNILTKLMHNSPKP